MGGVSPVNFFESNDVGGEGGGGGRGQGCFPAMMTHIILWQAVHRRRRLFADGYSCDGLFVSRDSGGGGGRGRNNLLEGSGTKE